MYAFFTISVRDFHQQFLDYNCIKIIFPYRGILYSVINYGIKETIKL